MDSLEPRKVKRTLIDWVSQARQLRHRQLLLDSALHDPNFLKRRAYLSSTSTSEILRRPWEHANTSLIYLLSPPVSAICPKYSTPTLLSAAPQTFPAVDGKPLRFRRQRLLSGYSRARSLPLPTHPIPSLSTHPRRRSIRTMMMRSSPSMSKRYTVGRHIFLQFGQRPPAYTVAGWID